MYYTQPELMLNYTPVKRRVMRTVTSYLTKPLLRPTELLDQCGEWLKTIQCDTLVGRGFSGAIAVALLAQRWSKHWAVVRKPNDGTHSEYKIEGEIGERWLFVDDLLSSGQTLANTMIAVRDEWKRYMQGPAGSETEKLYPQPEFVGALLYNATPVKYKTVDELKHEYSCVLEIMEPEKAKAKQEAREARRKEREYQPYTVDPAPLPSTVSNEALKQFRVSNPRVTSMWVDESATWGPGNPWEPQVEVLPAMTATELNDKLEAQMRPRVAPPTLRPGESIESIQQRCRVWEQQTGIKANFRKPFYMPRGWGRK